MTWSRDETERQLSSIETVWIRAAAALDINSIWSLQFLEVTAGDSPPTWRSQLWEYTEALLISWQCPGAEVSRWLSNEEVVIGPHQLPIQPLTNATVQRVNSYSRSSTYERLPWPCVSVDLASSPNAQLPRGSLVGVDGPTFYDFGTAAAAFLGVPGTPGRAPESAPPIFRKQDLTGRIVAARGDAVELVVTVEGAALFGAGVDFATPSGSERRWLGHGGTDTVTFSLAGPLPEGSWVVLHREGEWLDRRFLNWPYSMGTEPGVEIVVEPQTRLEALVSAGEGPTTEFKSELPPNRDKTVVRKSLKTAAAFANGEGGTILFGVTDDGSAVGVERSRGIEERLSNLVRSWISPLPPYHVDVLSIEPLEGRAVYALVIEQGDRPPYGCGTEPADLIYYVRRGATTFPIDAHEVRALARSRPPSEDHGLRPWGDAP